MNKHTQLIKQIVIIFLASFFLNAVWEVLHSRLYVHYKGGPITSLILLQTMFVDAAIISGLYFLSRLLRRNAYAVICIGGLSIAVLLEIWALHTNRWAYTAAMPLVPLVHVGVTPTVQLALTGLVALWTAKRVV